MATLLTVNIVLLPQQQINSSVYSQLWFVDQGIVARDEFLSQSMFLPVMVNVQAKTMSLLVLPDRVQISASKTDRDSVTDVLRRARKFVENAGIGFKLAGLNVAYTFHDDGTPGHYLQSARTLFVGESNPLHDDFIGQGATAGIQLRKPVAPNGHLQLDIRGGKAVQEGQPLYGNQDILIFNGSQEHTVESSDAVFQMFDRIPSILESMAALVEKFEAGLVGGV